MSTHTVLTRVLDRSSRPRLRCIRSSSTSLQLLDWYSRVPTENIAVDRPMLFQTPSFSLAGFAAPLPPTMTTEPYSAKAILLTTVDRQILLTPSVSRMTAQGTAVAIVEMWLMALADVRLPTCNHTRDCMRYCSMRLVPVASSVVSSRQPTQSMHTLTTMGSAMQRIPCGAVIACRMIIGGDRDATRW